MSVFWLSLWVFWSFSGVSRGFCLFLRFQWFLVVSKVFGVFVVPLGAFLVIFYGFRIFWTFVVHFSHFGSSKGVILEVFLYLSDFDILVILTGKINFFWQKKKNPKNYKNGHYTPKITKTTKCPKKKPPKPLNSPILLKCSKMTKITQKPLKMTKIPLKQLEWAIKSRYLVNGENTENI